MKSLRHLARAASARLHTEAKREAERALYALKLAQAGVIPLRYLPGTAADLVRASAKSAAAGVLRAIGGREPETTTAETTEPTAAQHRAAAEAWTSVGKAAGAVREARQTSDDLAKWGPPSMYEPGLYEIDRAMRSKALRDIAERTLPASEQNLGPAGRCPRCYFGGCDVFAVKVDGAVTFKVRCAECHLDQRIGDA